VIDKRIERSSPGQRSFLANDPNAPQKEWARLKKKQPTT
jgi:hypothetical protein